MYTDGIKYLLQNVHLVKNYIYIQLLYIYSSNDDLKNIINLTDSPTEYLSLLT